MILVALGANLPNPAIGSPLDACETALEYLAQRGVVVERRSRWYRSVPVPQSDQPDFVNGVALVSSDLPPAELLKLLHDIEAELGRTRDRPNEARVIDLDLLAHGDQVVGWTELSSTVPSLGSNRLILPHPRVHVRAFVLLPLRDVAPGWRHPVTGRDVGAMIEAISGDSEREGVFGDHVCKPLI